jgi:hypothetical protein
MFSQGFFVKVVVGTAAEADTQKMWGTGKPRSNATHCVDDLSFNAAPREGVVAKDDGAPGKGGGQQRWLKVDKRNGSTIKTPLVRMCQRRLKGQCRFY